MSVMRSDAEARRLRKLLAPRLNLTCRDHAILELLLHLGWAPILETLTQPLALAFEVDLILRDWFVNGYSSVTFERPSFNRGLTATWERVPREAFAEVVRSELAEGRPVLFTSRTWPTDAHSKLIVGLDERAGTTTTFDQLRKGDFAFDHNSFATIPLAYHVGRFADDPFLLRYRLTPSARPWEEELDEVLRRSLPLMRPPAPHPLARGGWHWQEGLVAIDWLAEAVRLYKPSQLGDEHTRHIFGFRLPICLGRDVRGNRIVLLAALRHTVPASRRPRFEALAAALEASIAHWKGLALACGRAAQGERVDLTGMAARIAEARPLEERLLEEIERLPRA